PTAAWHFLEHKIKTFVGWRHLPLLAEDRVVPCGNAWRHPARLAAMIGVFDDHAKAHLAVLLLDPSKYPYTWPVHLHDHIGTFRGCEKECFDRLPRRYGISVKRDHGKAMARKGKRDVLGRAGIEETKQHSLAFVYADGLPVAEHPVVKGRGRVHHLQTVIRRRTCADILHTDP